MNSKTHFWNSTKFLSPAILVLFVLFSYWLYGYRPIASYPHSAVDDGLYLRFGNGFVNWVCGRHPQWLGNYDCFLFSKAPLYGIFLGVLNLLTVPVRIGEFILLIGVPCLFAAACRPLLVLRGWALLLTAALLTWLPLLPSETHLLRNALQSILTSYLIIASIGLVLRWQSTPRNQLQWAALVGLLFSLSYLNREESGWISILVLFSFGLLCLLGWLNRRFSWRRAILIALVLCFCAAPLILLVCSLNYRSYGVFMTTIRRSDSFTAMFQRLTSLEPENHKRYVPISRETRFRAYELSPTYAKLKPFMEGDGSYWVAGIEEHSSINGYSPAEKEFFISNYEFALQYAVSCCGATNAVEAERFFSAIDQELLAAVKAGRIHAGRHGPAILAAPQKGDISRILKAWWKSLHNLLILKNAGLNWGDRSSGDVRSLEEVSLFVHSTLTPETNDGIAYKLRAPLVTRINQGLSVFYWATIPAMLVVSVLSFFRSRTVFFQGTIAITIPLLGLALFCLAMAVVDTLGFPFLDWMGYNVIGFSPLSVLSALTVVVTLAHFNKPKPLLE